MTKKIFYLSAILFLVASIIPFKTNLGIALKPKPYEQGIVSKDKFTTTALKPTYIKPTNISFTTSEDINKDSPQILGEAGIVINLSTNKILFEKNMNKRLPVASLVKIMTAIVAMEHMDINEKITVSEYAASIGENTMGITAGEKYTLEELLYGLILNSGNDAAYAIAEGVAGDSKSYTNYMNKKGKLLGANNTLFVDPSGLNPNKLAYHSTAMDMAKITAYSLNTHPNLREVYKTFQKELPANEDHSYKLLENQTNLLTTYPGSLGIKTGYTSEAGLCIVSLAKNQDTEILAIVLNSTDRKGDAILLLDYGFLKSGVNIEHNLL